MAFDIPGTGSISISGFASGIGGAVGDLFTASADRTTAQGDLESAQFYGEAAGMEGQASNLVTNQIPVVDTSVAIQQSQLTRQVAGVLGQQQAAVAGAGFKQGGSAEYLYGASAAQGALAGSLISIGGAQQKAQLQEQALGFQIQQQNDLRLQQQAIETASAEKSAATGADIGAGVSVLGGLAKLFGL